MLGFRWPVQVGMIHIGLCCTSWRVARVQGKVLIGNERMGVGSCRRKGSAVISRTDGSLNEGGDARGPLSFQAFD